MQKYIEHVGREKDFTWQENGEEGWNSHDSHNIDYISFKA